MKIWNRSNKLLIFIFFLVAIEGVLLLSNNLNFNNKQKIEEERLAIIQKSFDEVPVIAKTYSVYDQTLKKEIAKKNGNQISPLASLSKIMTIIISLEKYNMNDVLTISKQSSSDNANNILSLGEKWKIIDLVKFTLISSSNTGSINLVNGKDADFLNIMNVRAKEIGMQNTSFFNSTGLDINKEKAGSYGTALETNLLAIYTIEKYPDIVNISTLPNATFKSESNYTHTIKNTNKIITKIPNIIFSKTGFTTLAGGNLTIVFKNKMNHIISITLLGSTESARFSDMEKLVEIAYTL